MKAAKQPANVCVNQLKILADQTRLFALRELVKAPKSVSQLNETLCIAQNLLSHHLKVLRSAQLIQSKRQGKTVVYSVTDAVKGKSLRSIDLGCCRLSFG